MAKAKLIKQNVYDEVRFEKVKNIQEKVMIVDTGLILLTCICPTLDILFSIVFICSLHIQIEVI